MAILRHSKGVGKNAGDCDEVNFTLYLLLLFILILFHSFCFEKCAIVYCFFLMLKCMQVLGS